MKNLMAGLIVAAVLMPAAQLKQEETARGADELINKTADAITKASNKNKGHIFLSTKGYNLSQRYAHWKELTDKGYDVDAPLFGSTFIGW